MTEFVDGVAQGVAAGVPRCDTLGTVLCVGETMAMVTPSSPAPLASAEIFTITPGGAESNVASHLASRGLHTYWASRLGDDALGDRLLTVLGDRGIDLTYVTRDPRAPTGVYFKDPAPGPRSAVSYYRAGSAASRLSLDDVSVWPLKQIDWLHTSGITAALSPSCYELVEHLLRRAPDFGYRTSFDVNYRPALLPRNEAAERSLLLGRLCTVLLVGLDEAQTLWEIDTAEQVADLFPQVPHVVIKDGANEAVEFIGADTQRTVVRVPATPTDVVEAVGAGDAFAAGYLSALLSGHDARARLADGHRLASWTLKSLDDFHPEAPRRDLGSGRS